MSQGVGVGSVRAAGLGRSPGRPRSTVVVGVGRGRSRSISLPAERSISLPAAADVRVAPVTVPGGLAPTTPWPSLDRRLSLDRRRRRLALPPTPFCYKAAHLVRDAHGASPRLAEATPGVGCRATGDRKRWAVGSALAHISQALPWRWAVG